MKSSLLRKSGEVPRSYNEAYAKFLEHKEEFFDELGRSFAWIKEPTRTFDFLDPFYRWFPDGEMNACHNALDIHIENGHGEETAFIFVNRYTDQITEHTYREIYEKVGRMG